MPFLPHLQQALLHYPTSPVFMQWRSSESQTAAAYLRQRMGANAPEAELLAIVNFLLTGAPPPPNKPGNLMRVKQAGRLHGLLQAAWDANKRGMPASARQADKRLNYFDGTLKTLSTDIGAQAIELDIRQKYDAAIAAWIGHQPQNAIFGWTHARANDTVDSLLGMTRQQHLAVIDSIWNEILDLVVGNTAVNAMVDPALNAYVSSHSGRANAFSAHGFCFRCDSRLPADVTAHGFLPKYQFNPPPEILGTLPANAATGTGVARSLGMFKDNRDAVGEMVICVARQLRGCTKFPSPGHVGDAYIYAIKLPLGKLGFDTENWQVNQPVVSLWKPGEKAFYDVQPAEIIAHVRVSKSLAAVDGEYFRFQFMANAWTFVGVPLLADQQYLTAELAAIYNAGAVQSVTMAQDFQLG